MLLLVPVPERSTARKSCPASPPGLIVSSNSKLPPRLTWVTRSKVGVTPPFCALLERIHQNGLLKFAPPIKRLPLVSTSSVPHTGELGILIGLIQVTPPSVERLNCPTLQDAAVLQAWYWNPCPVPLVLSMVNHSLSPPPPPPSDGRRVQDWPPFSEPQMSSQNDCRRLR